MQLNEFQAAIFTWPSVLSDRPPVHWWLSPGEEKDAVTWCGWDKLKKWRIYWISRRRCQVFGQRDVCLMIVVCYLTWHDCPPLVEVESHDISLLLNINIQFLKIPIYASLCLGHRSNDVIKQNFRTCKWLIIKWTRQIGHEIQIYLSFQTIL